MAKLYEILFCWKKDLQSNGLPRWPQKFLEIWKLPGGDRPDFLPACLQTVWWPLGTCVCRAPWDLTWSPHLGGCIRAGGLTSLGVCGTSGAPQKPWRLAKGRDYGNPASPRSAFPEGKKSQFILKTPNGTPVVNTCVSRNLLLVPSKIQFLNFGMTQKRGWWCLFWGDFLKGLFLIETWILELNWIFR